MCTCLARVSFMLLPECVLWQSGAIQPFVAFDGECAIPGIPLFRFGHLTWCGQPSKFARLTALPGQFSGSHTNPAAFIPEIELGLLRGMVSTFFSPGWMTQLCLVASITSSSSQLRMSLFHCLHVRAFCFHAVSFLESSKVCRGGLSVYTVRFTICRCELCYAPHRTRMPLGPNVMIPNGLLVRLSEKPTS